MHSDRTSAGRFASRPVLRGLAATFAALVVAGCGATYRPVVTAISPVGPAAQPSKYAVAISSASPTSNGLVSIVDFSGDTILDTTLLGLNPYYFVINSGTTGYTLNSDGTLNSFGISTSLLASNVLQSTLTPNTHAVSLLPAGTNIYLAQSAANAAGVNAVGQAIGAPFAILQELLTPGPPIFTVGIATAPRVYALVPAANPAANGVATAIDTGTNTVTATLAVGQNPTYGVMTGDSRRAFVLNKGSNNVTVINSQANALDNFYTNGCNPAVTLPCTLTSTISLTPQAGLSSGPAGVAPIWADFAPTLNELVVANQGAPEFAINSYSVSGNVVTFQTSAQGLTAGQSLTLLNFPTSTFFNGQTVTVSATGLTGASFQAAFTHANVASTTELANGIGNGSVTIVSIPLCSQTTVTSNPNCDPANPIDAVGFGTVIANIQVGPSPIMVGVLQDGSQAFVANAGVLPTAATATAAATPGLAGSVSAINLNTDTVVATIAAANTTNPADAFVHGHPTYIGVTTGTPTGKVYVVSSDSTDITILRTDIDAIETHLSLQGNGISVRMTAP